MPDHADRPCSVREVCRNGSEGCYSQCFGSSGRAHRWWSYSRQYNLEVDLHNQVCRDSTINTSFGARIQTDLFYNSVPIAAPAFLISILAIPNGFPHHRHGSRGPATAADNYNAKSTFRRIDIPGTILILLAVLGLTAAFEEADKLFPWRSAYVITLLTVSGILWILLFLWERYVTLSDGIREPVLSWNFLTNRQMVGILL